MKKLLIIFILSGFTGICQPEQVAFDFYIKSIWPNYGPLLPGEPNYKSIIHWKQHLRYSGLISQKDDDYQEYAQFQVEYYFICKSCRDEDDFTANNDSIKISKEDYDKIEQSIGMYEFFQCSTESLILDIPREIHKKKKYKCKNRKDIYSKIGSIRLDIKIFWDRLTPNKWNLTVSPAVLYKNYYYVGITVQKNNDCQIWEFCIMKISKDMEVIDWCESIGGG